MKLLSVLRVLAGLATIGLGIWLFVRALPALDFQILAVFLIAGVFIIEAPRFQKTFRERRERMATYVEENVSAKTTLDRATRFRRWGWICYVAAFISALVGYPLLGAERHEVTFGVMLALLALGTALSFYGTYARTSVDFRAVSAAKPDIPQTSLWIATGVVIVVFVSAVFADATWHTNTTNWLFGALALCVAVAWILRWLRGWPNDKNSPP